MSELEGEISKDTIVVNELGLHARSAAKIAELAQNAKSRIWVQRGGEKVDAKSIRPARPDRIRPAPVVQGHVRLVEAKAAEFVDLFGCAPVDTIENREWRIEIERRAEAS